MCINSRFFRNGLVLVIALSVIGSACKTKKAMPARVAEKPVALPKTNNPMERFVGMVVASKNNGAAISFSADVDYKDNKQEVSLNVDLSAKRGEYIYMNAKAMGFVNVARIIMRPDSIRILDLLNRKYISASYRYMQAFSGVPLTFENLQNLIWANAAFDPTLFSRVDSSSLPWQVFTAINSLSQRASYNRELKAEDLQYTEVEKKVNMKVQYRQFSEVDGLRYPGQILINIEGEKKVECRFAISNFATVVTKEPQFVVPRSYKVMVY